jgi:hypothetical protein
MALSKMSETTQLIPPELSLAMANRLINIDNLTRADMFSGEMSSFEYINFNASLKQNTGDIDL